MRARQDENHWQKLLNGWKTGPKYQFKIYYNEVEVQKVKTQCKILRGQKRALYQVSSQMETDHRHSHAIYLYLRENLCSEF